MTGPDGSRQAGATRGSGARSANDTSSDTDSDTDSGSDTGSGSDAGSGSGSGKAIAAALAANIGVAIGKFVAFLFSGSSALLAETFHSVADSIDQVLLFVGRRRAQHPATALHPFGFGQFRFLYSFLVAIVIFLAGGAFSLWEGLQKVRNPEPLDGAVWAFAVLGLAVVLEGLSLRTAIHESKSERGRQSFYRFIRRTKTPEFPVVILEDFGALIGLLLAFTAITVTVLTGNGVWDGIGSLGIGVLLISISLVLAGESRSLLLNESANPQVVDTITGALSGDGVIEGVIHLRTMHLGPEQLLVAAKVAVPAEASGAQIAAAINAAEERIRSRVDLQCTIYLEPDLLDNG